jgi:hypothetical protein
LGTGKTLEIIFLFRNIMWQELLDKKFDEWLSAIVHLMQVDDQVSWVHRCSAEHAGVPQQCHHLRVLPMHVRGTICDCLLYQKNLVSLQMPGVHVGQFLFRWDMDIQNGFGQAHVKHRQLCQGKARVMTAMTTDAWVA